MSDEVFPTRVNKLALLGVAVLMIACSAAPPVLTADGKGVTVKKAEPPAGAEEIGPISAVHGSGCGGFGELGSYEGAYTLLKNQAAGMGANFVRIDIAEAPHQRDRSCFDNTYTLRGIAFRVPAETEPAPKTTPSGEPSSSPVAPP